MDYIIIALLIITILLLLLLLIKSKPSNTKDFEQQITIHLDGLKDSILQSLDTTSLLVDRGFERSMKFQESTQNQLTAIETARFNEFSNKMQEAVTALKQVVQEEKMMIETKFDQFSKQNQEQSTTINTTLTSRIQELQSGNEKKLDEMRGVVDEKLQKTLDQRLSQSFQTVSNQLESVHKSVGEMKQLSSDVGDLKKVLSNVKTRGIFGEVQLGAILDQILTKQQYEENIITKKNSNDRVEFAIKLPGLSDDVVYLPIDAKFPMDAYNNLLNAYEQNDSVAIKLASKELSNRIKSFGKDIRNKYIDVPYTTDFAIMFLPTEGLYAHVVQLGLIEELQSMKIMIAGPTTMAALLNSLQMGFRTLALQKRSSEVWTILEEVKKEFGTFETVLKKAQERINQANDEIEKLVSTRTRAINRKLKNVTTESQDSITTT